MMYKHKVSLQIESTVQDEFGDVTSSGWEELRSMRVKITPISGNESFLSHVDYAKTTHKIHCRYRQDINASMRMVFDDRGQTRVFRIIGVMNIKEEKMQMEIKATEEIN